MSKVGEGAKYQSVAYMMTIDELRAKYPLVIKYQEWLGSDPARIVMALRRAEAHFAPPDAVYQTRGDRHGQWVRAASVASPRLRKALGLDKN